MSVFTSAIPCVCNNETKDVGLMCKYILTASLSYIQEMEDREKRIVIKKVKKVKELISENYTKRVNSFFIEFLEEKIKEIILYRIPVEKNRIEAWIIENNLFSALGIIKSPIHITFFIYKQKEFSNCSNKEKNKLVLWNRFMKIIYNIIFLSPYESPDFCWKTYRL